MRKATTKLNAKSLINEIVTVAGVSKQNAENIFNLFSTAWQSNRVGLLTVLDSGIVAKARTARKSGPRAVKKAATKLAVTKTTAKVVAPAKTQKTAKKTAPQSVSGKKPVKLKKTATASTSGEKSVNA